MAWLNSTEFNRTITTLVFVFSVQESVGLTLVTILSNLLIKRGHLVLIVDVKTIEILVNGVFTLSVIILDAVGDGFIDRGNFIQLVERVLLIAKELLLGSQDAAWSAKSHVTNEIRSDALVMLHGISSDQRTSSSKTSLTMHSNSTLFIFNDLQKFVDDVIIGA